MSSAITTPYFTAPETRPVEDPSRRALLAACVGNVVEWYDFALFGALGVVLVPVFFPAHSGSSVLLAAFAIYATAFVARPLGAVVAGRRSDVLGRRTVLASVVLVMAVATAGIGLLPGHTQIGAVAGVAVVLLRAAQGAAAGGELGLAAVFIAEHASPGRRGLVASCHTATLALGVALGFGAGGLVLLVAPVDGEGGWWRIPFLLALPLGMVGIYVRRRVADTPSFERMREQHTRRDRPVREVWNQHRGSLTAAFALTAAGSLAFNATFVFLPNHLVDTTPHRLHTVLLTSVLGLVAAAGAALVLGRLSDRCGRRPVVLISLSVLSLTVVPLWLLTTSGSLVGMAVTQSLVGAAVGGVLSVAWMAELFPTRVRGTGLGMTAGLATATLGGTAPLVCQVLVEATGSEVSPAVYVAAMSGLALLAVSRRPETASTGLD